MDIVMTADDVNIISSSAW